MKKILFVFAAAAALLCSCNKSDLTADQGPKAVKFTVSNLGSYTLKSATLGLGEVGCSTVGIYAADLGANNVEATVSESSLTPASTIYWRVGQTDASQFVARYPHANDASINGSYAIPADQRDADVYTYHANVMTAVQSATPDPGTVAFNFKHPFAKVVVNITNNLGADAVASVVMQNVKLAASALDMTTAPATPTLTDVKSNVTAYAASATSYELILMPQAAAADMNIVVTTSQNSVYTFRITNASYNFEAGKSATAAVTLDPIGGSSFERVAVGSMSFTTTDWVANAATTIGVVGDPVLGNYYQIGGTIYTDADAAAVAGGTLNAWEKWYNMTLTAANTWTAVVNYSEAMADDESSKGLLIRLGSTYYKMYNGSENVGAGPYELYPEDEDHQKNVRLASASGKFTITFNSSTNSISVAAAE
ncbi:MAG: fimbrillin family protein [Bacteroidales bacterium]|nr:fimbrillin family protein [Bacteroidales bacterium]